MPNNSESKKKNQENYDTFCQISKKIKIAKKYDFMLYAGAKM